MEKRLEYVLRNFFLIYESPIPIENISIDYKIDRGGVLFIPDLSSGYFEKKALLDLSQVKWKKYKNKDIPFLFSSDINQIIEFGHNRLLIKDDIISCIFYFLTGWQEYVCKEKDQLGRFVFTSSIQKVLGIIQLPVVNYYFLILKEAIELAYGITLINKLTRHGKFVTCVTHDIDVWEGLWKRELKTAIQDLKIKEIFKILGDKFSGSYLSYGFNVINDLQSRYNFKSAFFFLPDNSEYKTHKNADYEIQRSKYADFISELAKNENEIGLHGSFTSSFDELKLSADLATIPQKSLGIRYHYLMYDIVETTHIINKQKLDYDSTLGFNSHPGFRNGTSFPFYLYDLKEGKSTDSLEIPLIVMDVSLFFEQYLNIKTAEEAFNYIRQLLNEIMENSGCLVLNWHNDAFIKSRQEWQKLLIMVVEFSKAHHSVFLKPTDVIKILS